MHSLKYGLYEFVSLTRDKVDEAIDVLKKAFFCQENVCKAVGLPESTEGQKELEELCLRTAKDGLSIIAIEKKSGRVVGFAFNKLQTKCTPPEGDSYFETYKANCKDPSSRAILQFLIETDAMCDLFEFCGVDCLLEIMLLGTLPEFGGNRIASSMCLASFDAVKRLLAGENVKVPIDGSVLQLEPVPKIAAAMFTSLKSQKIGRSLGFEIAAKVPYHKFEFNGKPYVVDQQTPTITLEYKRFI